MSQSFHFQNGVLQGCSSTLLQAEGSYLYENSAIITTSGTWTAPAGVSQLRVVLGGGGQGGSAGQDGSVGSSGVLPGGSVTASEGETGLSGSGGLIWYGTININEGQEFAVSIGAGGAPSGTYGVPGALGEATTFGAYSSDNGKVYPLGYTDIANGNSYGRTGVAVPLDGSSDGAAGGQGGEAGQGYWMEAYDINGKRVGWAFITTKEAGKGGAARRGANGFALVFWDK
jgi:hypothetical protein